jgi:spermidine synthase
MRIAVLIAFCLSGAAALIYEVAWMRALSLILGSTTYALSTMLSTFMAGLALGGYLGGRLADRHRNLLLLLGLLELGIGLFGLATMPLINSLPPLYFKLYKAFHLSPSAYFLFQFLLCAGIMLIPTTLMGATFPVVSKMVTSSMDELGKWVGKAYSFNTLGAIAGSFSAGFILIPLLGVKAAALTAASLNVTVAVVMILLSKARIKGAAVVAVILLAAVPLSAALLSRQAEWTISIYDIGRYNNLENFLKKSEQDTILFEKDYREGRVKVWRDMWGFLKLRVGGKNEGSGPSDIDNTKLLAYLPIASHPAPGDPQSFLNIGLGAGVTLASAKKHIDDLTLVEINDGVVEAVRRFGAPGLLDGVEVEVQDARNWLFLHDRKFDIITSGPSYPTEASSGNLFTREFYVLARERLNPGGVFCQSLPYYILRDEDVTMMINTFGRVFENVFLWKVPKSKDLVMVGSLTPFRFDSDEIVERVRWLNRDGFPLDFLLSRDPGQTREIVRENIHMPVNTDDRPILEFRAARNFITGFGG